jgi:hypothetical protein
MERRGKQRYRVGLSPSALAERLRGIDDLRVVTGSTFDDAEPSRGARDFVGVVTDSQFRVAVRSDLTADQGTGSITRVVLEAKVVPTGDGCSVVELAWRNARSSQGRLRLLGLVTMSTATAAWLFARTTVPIGEKLLLLGVFFAAFVGPLVAIDVLAARRRQRQVLALANFVERVLGPIALPEGDGAPYRLGEVESSDRPALAPAAPSSGPSRAVERDEDDDEDDEDDEDDAPRRRVR